MKKTTWLGILFAALVLGYLVISSFQRQAYRCRVCITFNGRRDCGTAAAQTEQDARSDCHHDRLRANCRGRY